MYCKYCGNEHTENDFFCPYCGETMKEQEKKPAKCWSVFANIGKILGIITIATCWIPIFGLYSLLPGIHGIVFAALGKNAKEQPYVSKASVGLTLSIVGTILSIAIFIGFIVIIGLTA